MKTWKLVSAIISILIGAEILREGSLLHTFATAFGGRTTYVSLGLLSGVLVIAGGIVTLVARSNGKKGYDKVALACYIASFVLCFMGPKIWKNLWVYSVWPFACAVVAGVDLYKRRNEGDDDGQYQPAYDYSDSFPSTVCPHCGASVQPGDQFCRNCGKNIAERQQKTIVVRQKQKKQINYSLIKKIALIVVGLLVLAGLGTGGYFIYKDYSKKKAREEARREMEQEEKAEQKRQAELEAAAWERATVDNTAEAYVSYIDQYPEGKHVDEAKTKLAHIEKMRLTDEEKYSVGNSVSEFFFGAAEGNEDRMLRHLSPTMDRFLKKDNATKVDAISYMRRLHADDVFSVSITLDSNDIQVSKTLNGQDEPVYTADFSFDQRMEREDTSQETFASFKGRAILNKNFKITTLTLSKLSSY